MTTSPQSASRLRPSRICRFLLCLVALKICLVGSMFVEPLGLKDRILPFLFTVQGVEKDVPASPVAATVEPARPLLATPTAHAAEAVQQASAPEATQGSLSRDALQRRQEELARKEQDLRTLERDIDNRLARLQELEGRIQAMLKEAEDVKSAKYRHLVDVLSNMKAKEAAKVLEGLDEKIAVKVLSGMRGRQAGEMLTFVNSGKAARLSEALARVQMPFE